jgi:hypothetical protein
VNNFPQLKVDAHDTVAQHFATRLASQPAVAAAPDAPNVSL